LAYTITTLGDDATLVGTSGNDITDFQSGGNITVNSFQGNDRLTLSTADIDGGSVGMGAGTDTLTITRSTSDLSALLGGEADTLSITAATDGVTVGGQSGDDEFTLDNAGIADSRFAGGQGEDEFTVTQADGNGNTIVGGSADDTFTVTAFDGTDNFINGQVGEDEITITSIGNDATVRGGSEDDEITNNEGAATGILLAGDNGSDTITDGAAAVTILGGGGSDTIDGATGIDTIDGGEGADFINYDGGDGASISVATTAATLFSANQTITFGAGFEKLDGFVAGTDNIIADDGITRAAVVGATSAILDDTAYIIRGDIASDTTFVTSFTGNDALIYFGDSLLTDTAALAGIGDYVIVSDASLITAADITTA